MKNDSNISLTEIQKFPIHYINSILTGEASDFILYEYGPTIASNYQHLITRDEIELKNVNPLFVLMLDVAEIIQIVNSNGKIVNIKFHLIQIIKRCTMHPYKYSSVTSEIAMKFIQQIRKYQYETKSLESALLNYAPIVQYSGKLVKPDLAVNKDQDGVIHIGYHQLEHLIDSFLVNNILDIMQNTDEIIDIDDIKNEISQKEISYVPGSMTNITDAKNRNAFIYYFLVVLRYVIPDDQFQDFININIKLNKTYNIVIKEAMLSVLKNI